MFLRLTGSLVFVLFFCIGLAKAPDSIGIFGNKRIYFTDKGRFDRGKNSIVIFSTNKNCMNCFPSLSGKLTRVKENHEFNVFLCIEANLNSGEDTSVLVRSAIKYWETIFPNLDGLIIEFSEKINLFEMIPPAHSLLSQFGVDVTPSMLFLSRSERRYFDFKQTEQMSIGDIKKFVKVRN